MITDSDEVLRAERVNIEIKELPITLNASMEGNFSSNLPIVVIDTGDRDIPDEPKIKGSVTIIEPNESNRTNINLLPTYSGYMEIEDLYLFG